MPIFSSQLVKVEEMSPEKGIKTIANHLRKLQEELEYRLMNLDSSNINEINANDTTILIEDDEGNFSELTRTAKELTSKIGDAEGNLSILQQKADSITAQVGDADGNVGKLEVRAEKIAALVSDDEGNEGSLTIRANAITQQVSDAEGNLTKVEKTAEGIETRISDANGNLTALSETAKGIETRITNANGDMTTLSETAAGIEKRITDASGNMTKVEERATGVETRIIDAKGNMTSVEERATGVEKRITDANGNMTSIEQKAGSIEERISDAQGNMTSVEKRATGVEERIVDAQGNITSIERRATGVEERIINADGDMTVLEADAEKVQATITTAAGDIATLQGKADAIIAQVGDGAGNVGTLETRAGEIEQKVSNAEGNVGTLTTKVNNITLAVTDKEGTVSLQVKSGDEELGTNGGVELTGIMTFQKLGAAPGDDTTQIHGGWIKADTLIVDAANVTGSLSSAQITLYGDMAVYETAPGEDQTWEDVEIGGHIGYFDETLRGGGIGVYQKNDDGNITGMLLCNNAYAELSFDLTGSYIRVAGDYIQYEAASYMQFSAKDLLLMELDDDDDDVWALHTRGGSYGAQADLGNSRYPWGTVYADTDTIETSDRNRKNTIEDLPDKYVAMFDLLVPRRFKLNNGRSGRFHVGYIAQEVEEAMTTVGLDSQEFGGFVKSKSKDEDGEPLYMLRYGEFGAIYAAKIKQMEARLARLEEARV